MPVGDWTPAELGMWDLNGDGNITQADLDLANAYGLTTIASAIQQLLSGATFGEGADLDFEVEEAMEEVAGVDTSGLAGDEGSAILAELNQPTIPNSLESVTEISNLGTVSYSGVTNWQAVPGGFQPLPPVAGGRKRLHQISQFHGGINQRSSPRDISAIECQEAINVSFNEIGRIKLCGNAYYTENSITFAARGNNCLPGFGLFQFTAPADQDGNAGSEVITLVGDGGEIDAHSAGGGTDTGFIDMETSNTGGEAPIIYASGNGVYVADASFLNPRKARIYVDRDDKNETVVGWSSATGLPLINAPTSDNENAAPAGQVTIQSGNTDVASSTNGSLEVNIGNVDTGTWNGDYLFYVSWLFDGRCETQLTPIGQDEFTNNTLRLNPSLTHTNSAPLGGDKRIEGGRIYFKKEDTKERYLLAEFSLKDGVRGALDTTFTQWTIGSNIHDLLDTDRLVFVDPPEIDTYFSLNQYSAEELYPPSDDSTAEDGATSTAITGEAALILKYKAVTTGPDGVIYVGNVQFNGRDMPDTMMCSMPGKPGLFPQYNTYDSPSSDGSPIRALASFGDQILQFKENGLYVINVAAGSPNTTQFFAESIYRDCGVFNQCQVFTTSFGVIFVNKFGVFIYDGSKVISLTGGKFNWIESSNITEAISNTSDAAFPSIGYDPRSQDIIVLKNVGDDATDDDDGAWVYSMVTQAWTELNLAIINANGRRFSNMIITSKGFLSMTTTASANLQNYNHAPNTAFTITYQTKDIDFGTPTQTKKIMKIYVTYKGDASAMYFTYGANGDTTPTEAMTNSEGGDQYLTNAGTTDHNVAIYTLNSHPANLKSIQLKVTGTCETDVEINDISILYRPRPIK